MRTQLEALDDGSATAPGQIEELDETIAVLEDEYLALREDTTALQEDNERLSVFGYVTFNYDDFEGTNSNLLVDEWEVVIDAHVTDRLNAYALIEYEPDDGRDFEVGLEAAWLEYEINQGFNPRFGIIPVPFGKYNLEHFDPVRDLVERPIVIRRVVPSFWNETGAGATGRFDDAIGSTDLTYSAFFVNGLGNNITDTRGLRRARGGLSEDLDTQKGFVGRLGCVPETQSGDRIERIHRGL